MLKLAVIFLFALFSQILAFESGGKGATVSVFLKDPQEFKKMQEDLAGMKASLIQNEDLDELLAKANDIAAMNDRCGFISLSEELDEDCQRFYEIDLPAFENQYMELTGEIRLGSMKMATTLEERTQQLGACTDALLQVLVSREQLYRLTGDVDLEPLDDNGAFDATYEFRLSLDSDRMILQERLANMWLDKCGEIVLRKGGDEFAPYFEKRVNEKNDSLDAAGSNLIINLKRKNLTFYVGMRNDIKGYYYLNGVRLFSETITNEDKGHLSVNLRKKTVSLPLGRDGAVNVYTGRRKFDRIYRDMLGRWVWKNPQDVKTTAPAVAAPVEKTEPEPEIKAVPTDDPIPAKDAAYAELDDKRSESVKAAVPSKKKDSDAKKDGSSGKIRWIPVIASGVAIVAGTAVAVVYNGKAKKERDDAFSDRDAGTLPKTYQGHYDDAGSYQKTRNIGIGVAIVGAIGMGLSFVF